MFVLSSTSDTSHAVYPRHKEPPFYYASWHHAGEPFEPGESIISYTSARLRQALTFDDKKTALQYANGYNNSALFPLRVMALQEAKTREQQYYNKPLRVPCIIQKETGGIYWQEGKGWNRSIEKATVYANRCEAGDVGLGEVVTVSSLITALYLDRNELLETIEPLQNEADELEEKTDFLHTIR